MIYSFRASTIILSAYSTNVVVAHSNWSCFARI